MGELEHRRLILHDFVTLDDCKELEFIHKSCSTVGYRPNVLSTTLSHLIATNCPHLILPFVPVRERLKEKVEEFFGCEYELCIEFTGLISWLKGASIGWHSDDNRPYLKQRDFTAVCYLNTYGKDFKGGVFRFQDGEPETLMPSAGDVAIYTAGRCNTHLVDEVTDGERLTLTLWFSRDSNYDEDAKLISLLSQRIVDNSLNMPSLCVPLPASINMYWFSPEQDFDHQSGFNICCGRMHVLGFDIYVSPASNCLTDFFDAMEPLQVVRGEELFQLEFVNILHALQVLQFYFWKASVFQTSKGKAVTGKIVLLSQLKQEEISRLKSLFIKDCQVVGRVFNYVSRDSDEQHHFDWAIFSAAVAAWEAYTGKLYNELVTSLPYWRTNQSIYTVSFEES